MHRIDSSTREQDKFGVGKDGFTEGEPGVTAPTEITDDWFDACQEEICNVIEDSDITLVKGTRNQLSEAIFRFMYSTAISNWNERENPKAFDLRGVVAGDGLSSGYIVAVGEADGADAYIVICRGRDHGTYWIEQANPKNFTLNDVSWNGSMFVAVGEADGADAYIVTSTTATGWTERTNPKNIALNCVAWDGSSLWVAVGDADGADAYIITSPDGITWTERSNPKNVNLYGVYHDQSGLWVAVGDADGADAYIITSPDGITWTERSNPTNIAARSVIYGDSLWVAVGDNVGGDSYIITSPDGITWTERTSLLDKDLHGVSYAQNMFVAVGQESYGPHLITSYDGITWELRVVALDNSVTAHLYNIAFSSDFNYWVCVGSDDGIDANISTSSIVPW